MIVDRGNLSGAGHRRACTADRAKTSRSQSGEDGLRFTSLCDFNQICRSLRFRGGILRTGLPDACFFATMGRDLQETDLSWTEGGYDTTSPTRARLSHSSDEASANGRPGHALYFLLDRLRAALLRPFDARDVWRLHRRIVRQSSLERGAEATLLSPQLFEQASLAARMGFWQCELPTDRLIWSNGTYNLFGFQNGSRLKRSDVLKSYSEASLGRLDAARGHAIEAALGFGLDAEIRTPRGEKRWIRISATVERQNGEPVRLFGIKQDITEEKRLLSRMSYLAEHDAMTGLANRTQFDVHLSKLCEPDGAGGTLMLIDLDGFKEVNDTFGHAVGDECLVETARRLSALCQSAELVARIGGDEFAVLFGPAICVSKIEANARRILVAAEAPINCSGRHVQIGASIGYAWTEGEPPAAVFSRADRALYAAKAAGRRTFKGPLRAASSW